jgi:hypothetical protein
VNEQVGKRHSYTVSASSRARVRLTAGVHGVSPSTLYSADRPKGETPEDAVVLLVDPRLAGDTLTYTVEVLEGEVPASSGPCSLFIDTFGRPLSPVSVAGVNRLPRQIRARSAGAAKAAVPAGHRR